MVLLEHKIVLVTLRFAVLLDLMYLIRDVYSCLSFAVREYTS